MSKRYEYKEQYLNSGYGAEDLLNKRGADGWELCGFIKGYAYLKRELPSEPTPTKEVVEKKVQLTMEVFIRKGLHIQREQFTLPEGYVPAFKEGSTVYWWPDNLTFKQAANAEDCVLIWCNASTKESPPTPPTTLQDQDKFHWTDKLVMEFTAGATVVRTADWITTQMENFKACKQPTLPKPQNKERIRVVDLFFECFESNYERSYVLKTSGSIPYSKFPDIKQSIESIINS